MAGTRRRAQVHAALGDPARLAVVDALRLGDRSPTELAGALGLASNLLAHHLAVLSRAGVVDRLRSEADRRRTYVRLRWDALDGVLGLPGPDADADSAADPDRRVVFVCTHNSARSQIAAAGWLRLVGRAAASAGTHPAERVHPGAVAAAARHGLDLTGATTAHLDDVLRPDDLLVAVCDHAYERLDPRPPGTDRSILHWSVPDPVPVGTADAFDRALDDLVGRVHRLAPRSSTP